MRATFRGVYKSVMNDNKKTLLDLVSEYNIIMNDVASIMCGCVPENISFQKNLGVKIPRLIPQVNFSGVKSWGSFVSYAPELIYCKKRTQFPKPPKIYLKIIIKLLL